jgi:hypothetical protein
MRLKLACTVNNGLRRDARETAVSGFAGWPNLIDLSPSLGWLDSSTVRRYEAADQITFQLPGREK